MKNLQRSRETQTGKGREEERNGNENAKQHVMTYTQKVLSR